MEHIDLRGLNRATLARQCLLERTLTDPIAVVEQVGGLQAQAPAPPFTGLWSRTKDLDRDHVLREIAANRLVRGTTMRGTIHLHTADQYRALRNTMRPLLNSHNSTWRKRIREEDYKAVLAHGRKLLRLGPTSAELRRALGERFPNSDPQAMSNVVRFTDPVLHIPDPDSRIGWKHVPPLMAAKDVIGPLDPGGQLEMIVVNCLKAMGPGTVKDMQMWSGVSRLQAVAKALLESGTLIEIAAPEGVTMYDLPDAPRPESDTPSPVRYLPMWDNLLLSHADRTRTIRPAHREYLASLNGMLPQTFLVDGFVHGTWTHQRKAGIATLHLNPFLKIPKSVRMELEQEGLKLLAFLEPDADHYAFAT